MPEHGIEVEAVTGWLDGLKAGDQDAARSLWRRYFESLARLARARLGNSPRAVADEEDAALSAFDSFCRGAAQGRFPRLDDRDDLWRVLVVIAERKAIDQANRERRQKRGGGRLDEARADAGPGLEAAAGREPTPEFAAIMAEECRLRLGELRDESLRRVALLRMEGTPTRRSPTGSGAACGRSPGRSS
jgi:hypothetical protein